MQSTTWPVIDLQLVDSASGRFTALTRAGFPWKWKKLELKMEVSRDSREYSQNQLFVVRQRPENLLDPILGDFFDFWWVPFRLVVFVHDQRSDPFMEVTIFDVLHSQFVLHLEALGKREIRAEDQFSESHFQAQR